MTFEVINKYILPRVRLIGKTEKERDVLSILYLSIFIVIFLTVLSFVVQSLKPIFIDFTIQIKNIYLLMDAFLNSKKEVLQYYREPQFTFGSILSDVWHQLFNSLKIFGVYFMSIITRAIFKKMNFISEIVVNLIVFLAMIFINLSYLEFLIVVSVLCILVLFIPIGSKRYFGFLQYLNYFEEVINNYRELKDGGEKNKKLKLTGKMLLLSLSFIILSYSLKSTLSIPSDLSMVLTLSILLLIYMNGATMSTEAKLLKKFIAYIIVFSLTVIGNIGTDSSPAKLLLLTITLFFALDRVLSLSKDARDLVTQKSVLYYWEHEDISETVLLSELIRIEDIKKINLDEKTLVKQLLIRYRLGFNIEYLELSEIYKEKNYNRYLLLVSTYEYFLNLKESYLEELEGLELLRNQINSIIDNIKNQKIFVPNLYIEYGMISYYLEDYKGCIEYLSDEAILNSLDNVEVIKALADSYKHEQDFENAVRVEKILLNR
ncbi:hypothetical protein HO998_04415 [Streptococcus suis]|nr:hypothetical protein [Streptococcus suis]NQN84863.1 hypothetical protein [Streptococcus suis]